MGAAIRQSSTARHEFMATSMAFGECPHALQTMTAEGQAVAPAAVHELLQGPCPVQKLTNHRFVQQSADGGILELLDRHGRD